MKYTTHEICADIASTMDRVRELDIEGHARAAALQCLADAKRHLEAVGEFRITVRPIQTSPFPQVALGSVPPGADDEYRISGRGVELFPSVPPSAADNQRVRNTATQAFRKARELLKGIVR